MTSSRDVETELARTRHLIIAADEVAAKELLLALGEKIEDGQRDDQLLEIFAQLGELYLVRTAYQGTEEGLRRMRDIMARYSAIRAGTRSDVDVQGTIASVDIDRMILRYSRRAHFLETGLAAAHGDHESAEAALLVLTDDTVGCPGSRCRTRIPGDLCTDPVRGGTVRRRSARAIGSACGRR